MSPRLATSNPAYRPPKQNPPAPSAFDGLGASFWRCHACHEPLGQSGIALVPADEPGISHWIYHPACDPRRNA